MELKDVLGEIEADSANLVHGRLLEWALTPPLWHAEAVGGRPHHQVGYSNAGHTTCSAGSSLTNRWAAREACTVTHRAHHAEVARPPNPLLHRCDTRCGEVSRKPSQGQVQVQWPGMRTHTGGGLWRW